MKFLVNIKRTEWGFVEVEASDMDDAYVIAEEAIEEVKWNKEEIEVQEVIPKWLLRIRAFQRK